MICHFVKQLEWMEFYQKLYCKRCAAERSLSAIVLVLKKAVPQDIRDSNIIILYKTKGDMSDHNYCGISLINIVDKLHESVLLKKIHILANRIYSEPQCCFRAE